MSAKTIHEPHPLFLFPCRDIAPMGDTLEQTNKNLDELVDLAQQLQQQTGIKLLWATCNLFAHPTYACGASTNPDAHVFAMAAAQVKKGLEVAKKLGAEGFGECVSSNRNGKLNFFCV